MTDTPWANQENGTLVATIKGGASFDSPWIVVRADRPEDLKVRLDALVALDLHATVAAASSAFQAAYNVTSGIPGTTVVPQPQAAAPAAAPAAPAPAPAAGEAPTCIHGARVFKSGMGKNGKAWSAWFCPTKQGTPGQCGPEWV